MQLPPNRNNRRPQLPEQPPQRPGQPPPNRETPQRPPFEMPRWVLLLVVGGLILWTLLQTNNLLGGGGSGQLVTLPYTVFQQQVEAGNVRTAVIQEQTIRGELVEAVTYPPVGQLAQGERAQTSARYTTTVPPQEDSRLLERLEAAGVLTEAQTVQVNPLLLFAFQWLPLLLIVGFFVWMMRRGQRQAGNVFGFGQSQAREYNPDRPQVRFEDVAGQDAAKQELTEIVDFLREPDKYIALGARIPRGVLLVGPPGTGKTLMARAVAGEASVAFFSLSASEFVEMFVGVGASRVRDLFRKAKAAAPSIVFIDEIDAVGRQRGAGLGGGNDEREQTLNQMLAEMDGFEQTESVIVMAATNRPDVLDPALLRPGRFDRQVTVGRPDRTGRLAILKIHTRGKPLAEDVDMEALARATIGFSGADIANLANEAALTAARKNRTRISARDFSDAFDRIVLGTESPPLSNPQERKVTAYHEAGHAVVAVVTPGADPVLKVTIVPRGQALGITAQLPEDDRRNYSERYLMARILVALGGRAAEELVFGEVTTGATNDLRVVTDLARRMVSQFGMSENIGPLNLGDNEQQPFLGYSLATGRNYSDQTAALIDGEVRRIVSAAYEQTKQILAEHREALVSLAEDLLESEVVDQHRVLELVGVKPSGTGEEHVLLPSDPHVDAAMQQGGMHTPQAERSADNGASAPGQPVPPARPPQGQEPLG